MSAISDFLKQILTAYYGKDVRQSIHDAIKQCYEDATGNPESVAKFANSIMTETNERKAADAEERSERKAADAEERSERKKEVSVERTRVNNIVKQLEQKHVELWSGSLSTVGSSVTLSDDITNYDYIEIYTSGNNSNDTYAKRFEAKNGNFSFSSQNIPDSSQTENFMDMSEMTVSINGNTLTITKGRTVRFLGGTLSTIENDCEGISKVVGIKYDIQGNAEISDLRIDNDGKEHDSAGEAVRAQVGELKDDLDQLVGSVSDYAFDFIGNYYGEDNKALATDGNTFDENGWRTSGWCLTTIGDLYFTNGSTVKICYYNTGGGFLKYEEQTIKENSWLKININYSIFRISYEYNIITSIRYLDNDTPFAINEIHNLTGDIQSFSKSIIEKHQLYNSTALNSQGETFTVNNYTTTDYIEINDIELFFDNDGVTSRLLICVYDENKSFVNYREYYITDGINKYQPNITSGKYLRFSYEPNHISNIRFFNSEMRVSNVMGYTDDVGVSLFSQNIVTRNKALATDGLTFDANGWVVTDYFSADCISLYTDVQSTIKIYDYTDSVYKEIKVFGKHLYRLNKHTVRLSYEEQQINDIRLLSDDYSFTSERIKIIDDIHYKIISNVKDLINAFETGGNYYIQSGVYDIINGLGDDYFTNFKENDFGIIVKSGKYIFAPNAKIVANYAGDNMFVTSGFSPINLAKDSYNVEFIGLNVSASNVKYAVHDEMGSIYNPYTHRYSNCIISQNNCIRSLGGGLGYSGNIEIDGCIFNGETNRGSNDECSYHNNISSGSMSTICIKNSIIKTQNGSFRFGYYGDSTDITNIIVTNCKLGREPVLVQEADDYTIVNMQLYAYNNTIG